MLGVASAAGCAPAEPPLKWPSEMEASAAREPSGHAAPGHVVSEDAAAEHRPGERAAPAAARVRAALRDEAERLLREGGQHTGLGAGPTPDVVLVSRRELARSAARGDRKERDGSEELVRARHAGLSVWLRLLELVPPGYDHGAALARALEARLLGFFEASRGRILLARDLDPERRRAALAHEAAHALFEQHFPLERKLADPSLSHDERGATATLLEGAASLLAERLAPPRDAGRALEPAPSDAEPPAPSESAGDVELPELVARGLDAPYVDGERFARARLEAGGWTALLQTLAAPPRTTASLLEPGAPPSGAGAVPAPSAPDDGFRLVHADTIGAQTLRAIVAPATSEAAALAAVRGWRGDRLVLFQRVAGDGAGATALAWRIELGDAAGARRAFEATRATWWSALDPPATARRWCRPHRDGGALGAWQQGSTLIVLALDAGALLDPSGCGAQTDAWVARLLARASTVSDPG